jgi:hypothetical protein
MTTIVKINDIVNSYAWDIQRDAEKAVLKGLD